METQEEKGESLRDYLYTFCDTNEEPIIHAVYLAVRDKTMFVLFSPVNNRKNW